MRDPNRIEPFLNIIKECWEKVPDWRFGQLIENVKRAAELDDLFYIEDDRLENVFYNIFALGLIESNKNNEDKNKGDN